MDKAELKNQDILGYEQERCLHSNMGCADSVSFTLAPQEY